MNPKSKPYLEALRQFHDVRLGNSISHYHDAFLTAYQNVTTAAENLNVDVENPFDRSIPEAKAVGFFIVGTMHIPWLSTWRDYKAVDSTERPKRVRPPKKSTQIASSVATSANATALPSQVINSKAISADKAISILETHASSYPTNSDVKRALILATDTLHTKNSTPQLVPSVHPDHRRLITEQTDRVIQKISGVPAQSCATALKSIPTPLQHEANVSPRVTRELTIKPTAVTESLKNATGANIVHETTRALLETPSASVIAARKLPSGDIHLTFASAAKKNLYENHTRLRSLFGPDCSVRSRGLLVVAHGILTPATDSSDSPATAAYLKLQNPHWPLEINFLRLGWPSKVKRLGLQTGSLIITLTIEDQANALIHHGVTGCAR
ncbi:hypothetical protein K3495_g5269 [Podosphaera aphanis]|nr:hypothetical protein K3495_g5269 [Podosphaera aphanis]